MAVLAEKMGLDASKFTSQVNSQMCTAAKRAVPSATTVTPGLCALRQCCYLVLQRSSIRCWLQCRSTVGAGCTSRTVGCHTKRSAACGIRKVPSTIFYT